MFPIFIWIKNYNGLGEMKISLDPNYKVYFEIKEKMIKELNLTEEELLIDAAYSDKEKNKLLKQKIEVISNLKIEKISENRNLYGEKIDSINTIVGKNGSGKSSILNLMSMRYNDLNTGNGDLEEFEHLIVYKTEEENKFLLEGLYPELSEKYKIENFDVGLNEKYFDFLKKKEKQKDFIEYCYSFYIDNKNNFIKFREAEKVDMLYGKFKLIEKKKILMKLMKEKE